MAEKYRVTADLPLSTIENLRMLAESQGVTLTDALRRAIATEALLQQRIKDDNRVLLQSKDGTMTELLFNNK
jgi:hypothetical protein